MSGTLRFVNNFHKLAFQILKNRQQTVTRVSRSFRTTNNLKLREITENTDGNVTVVEGKPVNSPREDQVLKLDGPDDMCPLCKLNMDIKYTDVMIISQFVQDNGEIVPRQVSGICYAWHAKMKNLIHQAHAAGLMQNLRPHIYPAEYSQMDDFGWKQYNVYYLEGTDEGKAK